jgi:hypothetical protein
VTLKVLLSSTALISSVLESLSEQRFRVECCSDRVPRRVLSSKTRRTKNQAALALRMAAQGLHRSQTFLGDYFRHMKARIGPPKGNDRSRSQAGPHRLSHGHHSSGIRHHRLPRTASASAPKANETPSPCPRTWFRPRREGGCSLGEPASASPAGNQYGVVVLPVEDFSVNGQPCLNCLCQPRGQAQRASKTISPICRKTDHGRQVVSATLRFMPPRHFEIQTNVPMEW